jgi:hypothetical protein
MRGVGRIPVPVITFALGLLVGAYLGNLIRGLLTVLFFVLLVAAAYYIWAYFERQKRG